MRPLIVLAVAAAAGLAFASWQVVKSHQRPPEAPPLAEPARAPFPATVAGAGLVEPAGEVIAIGAPVAEIIAAVPVVPGMPVAAGDVLFRLDDRVAAAQVLVAEAQLAVARAVRAEAQDQADRLADEQRAGVLSIEERARRRFAVEQAAARTVQAEAQLAVARAELERRTVRAPSAGTVLRVAARAGEAAPMGRVEPPLVTLGDLSRLRIRVDIDENDAWRVQRGARAEAAVRGNAGLRTPLTFDRIEPYVVPKRSLTGNAAERVDTRVLQVIYRIDHTDLPLYPGQQMDVFIETTDPATAR
jgi:RND family efflux transporter MFP subunit